MWRGGSAPSRRCAVLPSGRAVLDTRGSRAPLACISTSNLQCCSEKFEIHGICACDVVSRLFSGRAVVEGASVDGLSNFCDAVAAVFRCASSIVAASISHTMPLPSAHATGTATDTDTAPRSVGARRLAGWCVQVEEDFKALKLRRKYKWIVVSADPTDFELTVESKGAPTATVEDLIHALPPTECRYRARAACVVVPPSTAVH